MTRRQVLTNLSACTVQIDDGSTCAQGSAEGMPFPICGGHASMLYRHVSQMVDSLASDQVFRAHVAMENAKRDEAEMKLRHEQASHHVYYLRVSNLIKIGYTRQIKQRMAQYPPGSRLLAVERGDHVVEAQRHQQFAHLLTAGNEWFKPAPDLMAHIEKLRQSFDHEPLLKRAKPGRKPDITGLRASRVGLTGGRIS